MLLLNNTSYYKKHPETNKEGIYGQLVISLVLMVWIIRKHEITYGIECLAV